MGRSARSASASSLKRRAAIGESALPGSGALRVVAMTCASSSPLMGSRHSVAPAARSDAATASAPKAYSTTTAPARSAAPSANARSADAGCSDGKCTSSTSTASADRPSDSARSRSSCTASSAMPGIDRSLRATLRPTTLTRRIAAGPATPRCDARSGTCACCVRLDACNATAAVELAASASNGPRASVAMVPIAWPPSLSCFSSFRRCTSCAE